MRSEVDSRWISIERRPPGQALAIHVVNDRRTGFLITLDDLIELGKNCPADVKALGGGLLLERLCSVYFVVSPDWKIRAIMDEATWKSRGDEILAQIREELWRDKGPDEGQAERAGQQKSSPATTLVK